MSKQRKQELPSTLLPFDPVATLNEFVLLLESLRYLSRDPRPAKLRQITRLVRYATISEQDLMKRLEGCNSVETRVQVSFFHPELKLRLITHDDGQREVQALPDLAELKDLTFHDWYTDTDLERDCIAFQVPEWESQDTEHAKQEGIKPSRSLYTMGVDSFVEDIREDWPASLRAERIKSWTWARQHVDRLEIRLNGGQPEFLDIDPRCLDSVNSLYHGFLRPIVDTWQLTRKQPPQWVSKPGSTRSPMSEAEIMKLSLYLTACGRAFNLLRCTSEDEPYFTDNAETLASKIPMVVLSDSRFVPKRRLPIKDNERCRFVKCNPSDDDYIHARCERCGFSFKSEYVSEFDLEDVFWECGQAVDLQSIIHGEPKCRLRVSTEDRAVWLDETIPFPVNPRSAIFVLAVIENHPKPISGRAISERYPEFPANKVSYYRNMLPAAVQKLIRTDPYGSYLLPEAWNKATRG